MRFTNGVLTAVVLALAPLQSSAQETAANMPIADLHFHPGQNGKTPADVRDAFDRAGVRWFGLGAVSAPDALQASRAFGDRSISWDGQWEMNQILVKDGVREIENLANPDFKSLVANLEQSLAAKRIVGIGELFVNNAHSTGDPRLGRKMVIDGPVIRTLFELAAKYDAFVGFHMEGDADSVAQLERLAASNPKGRIILNHCGVNLTPSRLDHLLDDHPNLFCEFSVRYPPVRNPKGVFTEMFNDRAIGPGWKDVIVKHADRFMVGTDAEGDNDRYVVAIQNVRSGLLANLPIDVARKVAYSNAQALFGLK